MISESDIPIHLNKVKAHTGEVGNEFDDAIALNGREPLNPSCQSAELWNYKLAPPWA